MHMRGHAYKLKDQITPRVKPSDCYETRVMTWDILGWWEQIGGWIDR